MEQSNSSSRLSKVSIKASSGLWLTSSAFRSLCRQYSCTSAGLPDRSSVSSRLCSQFSSTSCGQPVTFRLVRALLAQCRKRSRGLPLMSRLVSALSFTVRDSRAVKCWMPDRSAMPSPASRRSVTALSSVPVRRPSAPAPPQVVLVQQPGAQRRVREIGLVDGHCIIGGQDARRRHEGDGQRGREYTAKDSVCDSHGGFSLYMYTVSLSKKPASGHGIPILGRERLRAPEMPGGSRRSRCRRPLYHIFRVCPPV